MSDDSWDEFLSRTGAIAGVGSAAAPGNSLGTFAGLVLVFARDRARAVFPFNHRVVIVGREPTCDIVLNDEGISRRHAMFEFGAGRWKIEDLESTTGTFVARQKIIAPRVLMPLDEIRFGNDLFKFVAVGAESYQRCVEKPVISPTPLASTPDPRSEIVGGPEMHKIAAILGRLAGGAIDLVLVGEAGTEKEACARHLHALRGRTGAFVRVDLFGRGPDALAELAPNLVAADGGTLFLEDIDPDKIDDTAATARSAHFIHAARALAGIRPRVEPPREDWVATTPPAQVRPTRTMTDAAPEVAPRASPLSFAATISDAVSGRDAPLDVHLVFGTTRAPAEVAPQRYLLNVPPLRERKEDIDVLCRARLRALGRAEVTLDDWFLCALVRHDHPGNVRELEQILAAALARATTSELTPDLLPPAIRKLAPRRR